MARRQPATFSSPDEALAELRQLPVPRSGDELREQLGLLDRALELIQPQTEYQREILNSQRIIVELLRDGREIPTEPAPPEPAPPEEGPASGLEQLIGRQGERGDEVIGILNEQATLLNEIVRGITDTTDLPAGLTGRAATRIGSGQEGIATFDLSGGEFAATVEAAETVLPQQRVRVLPDGMNLVIPVETTGDADQRTPSERARAEPGQTVDANTDILANDIEPTAEGSVMVITVCFDTSLTLNAQVNPAEDDVGDQQLDYKQGGALDADSVFTFDDLQLSRGDFVNWQVDTQATLKYFVVNEVFTG